MDLNEAQLLFSLFFAIYFGLIIDRSHEMYQPYDTYSAWMGVPHNLNRLIAAWIILFILPGREKTGGFHQVLFRRKMTDSVRGGAPFPSLRLSSVIQGRGAVCIPRMKKMMASRMNPNWATSKKIPETIEKKNVSINSTTV